MLFHFAPQRLAPGSIIEPGNFGRILGRYGVQASQGQFGNPWMLARELIFEGVRVSRFPDRPSRLEACFALPDMPAVEAYRRLTDVTGINVLHEVEMVDPAAPTHQAPFGLANLALPSPFMEHTGAKAAEYWAGGATGPMEIVTMSRLRIVRAV